MSPSQRERRLGSVSADHTESMVASTRSSMRTTPMPSAERRLPRMRAPADTPSAILCSFVSASRWLVVVPSLAGSALFRNAYGSARYDPSGGASAATGRGLTSDLLGDLPDVPVGVGKVQGAHAPAAVIRTVDEGHALIFQLGRDGVHVVDDDCEHVPWPVPGRASGQRRDHLRRVRGQGQEEVHVLEPEADVGLAIVERRYVEHPLVELLRRRHVLDEQRYRADLLFPASHL